MLLRDVLSGMYRIRYANPKTGEMKEDWVNVKDITSLKQSTEQRRKRYTDINKLRDIAHRDKYKIAFEMDFPGYNVIYNPIGDGSCQFSALSHQLAGLGKNYGAQYLRQLIVDYIESNRYSQRYVARGDFASWLDIPEGETDDIGFAAYLRYMRRSGSFGDNLTLRAASELFVVQI